MGRRDPVVVDSSVWIPFLEGSGGLPVERLKQLLRADRAAVTGIVLAEVLQGARGERDRYRLQSAFDGVRYVSLTRALYLQAGELSARLRRERQTIPLSDALVATAALGHGLALLADDDHFDAVPGLELDGR